MRSGDSLALLVEGEDLQLDGEVDLADVDAVGDGQHARREVEDAADAGGDEPVADVLGGGGRGGDDADGDAERRDHLLEAVQRLHDEPADLGADDRRVGVDQGADREAAGGEAAVVGERVPEVADPDDDDRPVLGEAELAGDLVDEVVDVVADAAGAVRAEVGEVLAQLGRVDAGGRGEFLGGDGRDALVAEGTEGAEVDRQPGDGGLGDALAAVTSLPVAHRARATGALRVHVRAGHGASLRRWRAGRGPLVDWMPPGARQVRRL